MRVRMPDEHRLAHLPPKLCQTTHVRRSHGQVQFLRRVKTLWKALIILMPDELHLKSRDRFILSEMTPLPCKERYQFECLSLTFHLNLVRLSSPFSLLSIWRFARSHTSKHPALEKRRQTGISWLESMVAYSIFFLNPQRLGYGTT